MKKKYWCLTDPDNGYTYCSPKRQEQMLARGWEKVTPYYSRNSTYWWDSHMPMTAFFSMVNTEYEEAKFYYETNPWCREKGKHLYFAMVRGEKRK